MKLIETAFNCCSSLASVCKASFSKLGQETEAQLMAK
jgi:hypothetical protein